MGGSGACLLARRCPDTPCLALTAAAGQPQAAGNRGLVAAQCGFCGYFGSLWPCRSLGGAGAGSVQRGSARSHQGGYYHPRAGWYSALVSWLVTAEALLCQLPTPPDAWARVERVTGRSPGVGEERREQEMAEDTSWGLPGPPRGAPGAAWGSLGAIFFRDENWIDFGVDFGRQEGAQREPFWEPRWIQNESNI